MNNIKIGIKLFLTALLSGLCVNMTSFAQTNIYIASAPWCSPCKTLATNLDKKGIKYVMFNLSLHNNNPLLVQLTEYVGNSHGGIPVTFIDSNNNHYFDDGEPYAIGSVMGEGLIDILNDNHPTISKEDYEIFTRNGGYVLSKYHNIHLKGYLSGNDLDKDSIDISGTKYCVTIENSRNSFTVKYKSADSESEVINTFDIKRERNGSFNYSILRRYIMKKTMELKDTNCQIKTYKFNMKEVVDTNIPTGVIKHLNDYFINLK